MPRSRGGASRPAPSRPRAPPPPPPRAPQQQQQQRGMTTTAGAPPKTQQQSPGLFGQMASTAAGVAVGSSIGHMVGGWFGGGRGAEEAYPEQQQQQNYQSTDAYAQPMDQGLYSSSAQTAQAGQVGGPCAADIKSFTSCMEQQRGDMNVCGWYLEQLKACQQAARQY